MRPDRASTEVTAVCDPAAVARARPSVRDVVRATPLLDAPFLGGAGHGRVLLKAENLQRTGSFKVRGATARLAEAVEASAAEGRPPAVTTGSAGNHAQALAFSARALGLTCRVHMPVGAPLSKIEGARRLGAEVVDRYDTVTEAVAAAEEEADRDGLLFVHPYDDLTVIAGQGSIGAEIGEEVGDPALVVVPLGGGGLLAGIAVALRSTHPAVRIVGVQAARCAPWPALLDAGGPPPAPPPGPIRTLADGIAVKTPGLHTRPIVEALVDDVVVVDEDAIGDAMISLAEHTKLIVEGAGAVGVAALRTGSIVPPANGTTVVVLSGGNVDVSTLAELTRRSETMAGRRLVVDAVLDDRPGALAALLAFLASERANLLDVTHVREGVDLHVGQTGVQLILETRGPEHGRALLEAARAGGHDVRLAIPGHW